MKKILFILLFFCFLSSELHSMEDRKRKRPEPQQEKEKEQEQPPIKQRKIQLKTLQEIAQQTFLEVCQDLENLPELLESIPANELREDIRQNIIQRKTIFEETLLHNAQSEEEIERFLSIGLDPNLKDRDGRTALNALIDKGKLKEALFLAKIGKILNVTSSDDYGATPLQRAIQWQNIELINAIVELIKPSDFFDQLAKYNKAGNSVFTLAIRYMPEIAEKWAKEYPTLTEVKNNEDETPLMVAARFQPSLIQLFIDQGADSNKANHFNKTVLMYAAQGSPESVKIILKNNPELIYLKDTLGHTALMYAAEYSNAQAVQLLINAGANVDDKTKYGSRSLRIAAKRNNPSVIETLLKAGANINDGSLNGAIQLGSLEAVTKLIELGVDLNLHDYLHNAISFDQPLIIKKLLEHGALVTKEALNLGNKKALGDEILNMLKNAAKKTE